MTNFEKQVKDAAEQAVLKIIREGGWVMPDYANRYRIPADFMTDCWNLVDKEKIKAELVKRLELELAERIVNKMAEEISTDIKQILSNKERREEIRAVVRENIDRLTKK
jgi:hypothetical protein